MTTTAVRRGATLLIAIPLALWTVAQPAMAAERGLVRGAYLQTNLVSNIPGMAAVTDPNLKNPWGLSSSSGSPIWASHHNAGVGTFYSIANGATTPLPLMVQIPASGNLPGWAPYGTILCGSGNFEI